MIVATLGKDYNRYIKLFSGRVIEVRPDNDALCLGPFPSPRLFLDKARRPLFLQHLVPGGAQFIQLSTSCRNRPADQPSRGSRRCAYISLRCCCMVLVTCW